MLEYHPFLIRGLRRGVKIMLSENHVYQNGDEPTEVERASLEAKGYTFEPSTIESERLALSDETRFDSDRAALLEKQQREHDARSERARAGVNTWR